MQHKTHNYAVFLILLVALLVILTYLENPNLKSPAIPLVGDSPNEILPESIPAVEPTPEVEEQLPELLPERRRVKPVPQPKKVVIIEIKNLQFNPSEITIEKGTTVEWINNDEDVTHNIYSVTLEQDFNSRRLEPGQSYSYTFTKEGGYPYSDSLFTFIKGKIIVE